MQIAAAYVQRNVRRIYHSVEQREEVGHDAFYLVGYENLVAVKLYLVALQVDVRFNPWEVQYAGKVERVVNVKVNPEQRVVLHGVKLMVKLLVVFILKRARCFCPKRLNAVDDVVLFCFNLFAIFPFCLFAESNRHGHELAVFVQQALYAAFLEKLFTVVRDMEDYVRASAGLFGVVYFKRRASVTTPFYRFRSVLIALCYYFDLVANHECAVETKSEVADYRIGVVLVFVEEVVYAGECNLVDVFVDFLFGHAYTVVAYG